MVGKKGLSVCVLLFLSCGWALGDDRLDSARRQFELHNYKTALTELEGCLANGVADDELLDVEVMRAECLLKLRRTEESISAFQSILAGHRGADEIAHLHFSLAKAAVLSNRRRHLAIIHYENALESYLASGASESAADAAIGLGEAYVRAYPDWDKLIDHLGIERPENRQAGRRLQHRLAVHWLDRGIALTVDDSKAASATYRKASLLYRNIGTEGVVEEVLRVYRELVRKWPESPESSMACMDIARVLERQVSDYVGAVRQYRKVVERHSGTRVAKRAQQAIERITSPLIRVGVEGVSLPGENARIDIDVRNVPRLRFTAFRVDLFKLVREIGRLSKLDEWKANQPPVATWSVDIPDGGEHKRFSSRQDQIPPTALPVSEPGAYVIVAEAEGDALSAGQADRDANAVEQRRTSALLLVSGLAAISKGGKDGAFVWAVDSVTGEPARADLLVQRFPREGTHEFRVGRTDELGLYEVGLKRAEGRGGSVAVYLRRGEHYAICHTSFLWYWWGYPNDYRFYGFTDRPVYRPDQTVHFKLIARRHRNGEYQNVVQKRVEVTLRDPQGEAVLSQWLTTNDRGSVSGDFALAHGMQPVGLGVYRIDVEIDGRRVYAGRGGTFRVEEYRKPEFEVIVDAGEPRYDFGRAVDVRVSARYYFGSPVAGASIAYTVHRTRLRPTFRYPIPYPWYFDQLGGWWQRHSPTRMPFYCYAQRQDLRSLVERGELTTGADGVAMLRFTPESDGEDDGYRYVIDVEATDSARRTVTGSGSVNVTRAPFTIHLQPQRYIYQPGDTVQIDVEAVGPNGEAVAFVGRVRVLRGRHEGTEARRHEGTDEEKVLVEEALSADADGEARFRWRTDEEGRFRVVVTAVGAGGVEVKGECAVWVAQRGGRFGHYGYGDVELVLDKLAYEVGETARLLVNTRFDVGRVLLTTEADELIDRKIIDIRNGGAVVEFLIEPMHRPNFYLVATLVHGNKVYQDMLAVVVPPLDQFLEVGLEGRKKGTEGGSGDLVSAATFLPGDEVGFVVTTLNADGEPVDADVAVMMVDASLYYIQKELRQRIQEYFYGKVRPHSIRTQTSFDVASFGGGYIRSGVAMMEGGAFASVASSGSVMMARTSLDVPAASPLGPEFATAAIRREFPDSVLWVGHLETGADGRASFDVTFPDSLTTWRLIAIAVDDETRVGETSLDLVTRKEVIARLTTPRFLVERDQCKISVVARNDLEVEKTVRVSLEGSGPIVWGAASRGGKILDYVADRTVELTLASETEAVIDFEVVATGAGSATFIATVATDVLADAMEITVPVRTFGSPKLVTRSGVIRDVATFASDTVEFTLPEQMDSATPVLEVHLNPTIAGVMLDAIPYLLDYPYGCTEQTMSRFLPAVLAGNTLERLGVKLSDLAARVATGEESGLLGRHRNAVFNDAALKTIVSVGLGRLTDAQNGDGGWGWWSGGVSDPYMTAYVVYGLAEAKRCSVTFDRSLLDRGAAFLKKRIDDPSVGRRRRGRGDEEQVRAWMLYALSVVGATQPATDDLRRATDAVFEGRDELTDYARAMLALVLHSAGDSVRAGVVMDNLDNTVQVDGATGTVHWGRSTGYHRWFDNGLESTSMVLRALLAIRPDHPHVVGSVNWLVGNRHGARWRSTKDTAFAVYALADYLEYSGELEADMTVTVTYDDTVSRSFIINSDNVLTFDTRMIFAARHLTPGPHTIRIERQGRGNLYHSIYLDYFTQEDPIEAAGAGVRVKRRYVRLVEKQVERTRRIWDSSSREYVEEAYLAVDYDREPITAGAVLGSGDLIEVILDVTADGAAEYVMIEDPKPAGCEPVDLHSGYDFRRGFVSHFELRDEYVAFFASYLPAGKQTMTYRLRCETPGRFGVLPTRVEAMYSPYFRANSASARISISTQ